MTSREGRHHAIEGLWQMPGTRRRGLSSRRDALSSGSPAQQTATDRPGRSRAPDRPVASFFGSACRHAGGARFRAGSGLEGVSDCCDAVAQSGAVRARDADQRCRVVAVAHCRLSARGLAATLSAAARRRSRPRPPWHSYPSSRSRRSPTGSDANAHSHAEITPSPFPRATPCRLDSGASTHSANHARAAPTPSPRSSSSATAALRVDVETRVRSGSLRVWVDDRLVLTTKMDSPRGGACGKSECR